MSEHLNNFFKLVQQRVNASMKHKLDSLPSEPAQLKEAMEYALLLGGKRARPFLVYATGLAFGGKYPQLDQVAASVECIHSYSLIHDDMPEMDNDLLRRGQATVHAKFGVATALLAGDTLQALAYSFITDKECRLSGSTKALLCKNLAEASGFKGMCGGQALDLEAEHQKLPQDKLEKLHSLKTGALITCAVQMGYLAAKDEVLHATNNQDAVASALGFVECFPVSRELEYLTKYAQKVGLAFQVWDDVLDVSGDEAKLGKTVGSDEALEKSTYVVLMGLEQAKVYAQQLVEDACKDLANLEVDTSLLKDFAHFCVERDH